MTTKLEAAVLAACLAAAAIGTLFAIPAVADSAQRPCGPSLIENGSFEHGAEPGSYTTLKAGSSAIDDWTITTGTVDIVGGLWPASDGERSVDLDGVSFGGISQSFKTEPDKTYVVTFDLAGNGYGLPAVKRMKVTAAGKSAQFTYDLHDRPTTNKGWQLDSWQFVAKDKSTTLEFDSLDTENGYFGPVLDNVRVRATCSS